jgi:ABC-type histidine transport system ATPase subunit
MFMAVSAEEFRRVPRCETANEVWNILEATNEGTKTVKNSKLQMLTTKFEEIRMKDNESFDKFYAKLNDVVNSSFNLGKRVPKTKIIRRVLRFLPERIRPKVTVIQECKDLDAIKIEKVVGSLQTY